MSLPVEQVKDRLNIVDIVSSYVRLEKAGINFKGRCPFHNEKTPSFFVSPSRQNYHCFGCDKGGDVISFVQEIEGLDFMEALTQLASRAGVVLKDDPKHKNENKIKEEVRRVLESAKDFYTEQLKPNDLVKKYLKERGISDESIKNFDIGWAPAGWRNLQDYLVGRGFSVEVLKKAGLVSESTGKDGRQAIYDKFRSRIMFPLADTNGKVVGFSGRIFGPESEKDLAKYLNSPQTIVFDKSKVLYAYDKAKEGMRRKGRAILVEGQMDVVMAHQVGLSEAVAVSGTALTASHLGLLKRLVTKVVMAFDSDKAGISASRRALELCFELDLDVKIASLPEGKDPADIALSDKELLVKSIDQAPEAIDYYLDIFKKDITDKKELARFIKVNLYPLVLRLVNLTDKAHFVKKIADAVDLTESLIWQDLEDFQAGQRDSSPLFVKKLGTKPKDDSLKAGLFNLLAILSNISDSGDISDTSQYDELKELLGEDVLKIRVEEFEKRKNELSLEVDLMYGDNVVDLKKSAERILIDIKRKFLKGELNKTLLALKDAETNNDLALVDNYVKKCKDISQSINNLGNQK